MLVSTKGRYALRVMLELAQSQPDAYMPLPLIAQRQGISEKYLESIIATRSSANYSVGEILRLTEGSLAPVTCLEGAENPCPRAGECTTLPMWQKLDDLINTYLDSVSLSDLLSQTDGNAL